jgi:tripartite-type tricarboxylate transporter receptor subunit TctC
MVVRAFPDGYTLGYANVVTLAINKTLLPRQPYDPDRDLALIGQFLSTHNLLAVNNSLPVRSVSELVDYAKRNPGTLQRLGGGTAGHLGGGVQDHDGHEIVRSYKAARKASPTRGQVQVMFDNLTSISPHVKAGKLRGLGVSGPRRSPVFAELPTIAEAGVPGYETTAWGGLVAPVGTPKAIISKLNAEVNRALQMPALKERFAAIDAEPVGGTIEAFAAFVKSESAKWGDVVRKSGAKLTRSTPMKSNLVADARRSTPIGVFKPVRSERQADRLEFLFKVPEYRIRWIGVHQR